MAAQFLHALWQGDAAHLAVAEAAVANLTVGVGDVHTGEKRLIEGAHANARDAGMEIHGLERGIAIESIVANLGNLIGDRDGRQVGGAA